MNNHKETNHERQLRATDFWITAIFCGLGLLGIVAALVCKIYQVL